MCRTHRCYYTAGQRRKLAVILWSVLRGTNTTNYVYKSECLLSFFSHQRFLHTNHQHAVILVMCTTHIGYDYVLDPRTAQPLFETPGHSILHYYTYISFVPISYLTCRMDEGRSVLQVHHRVLYCRIRSGRGEEGRMEEGRHVLLTTRLQYTQTRTARRRDGRRKGGRHGSARWLVHAVSMCMCSVCWSCHLSVLSPCTYFSV